MDLLIEKTELDGVICITPPRFGDDRGYFSETWNQERFAQAGLPRDFAQDNHSFSGHLNTLRGLHYQAPPHAQGKLVRCGRGRIWDVAVDIRKGSASYGAWTATELSSENGKQIWIPAGFLHGFLTLEDETEVLYKCTHPYVPAADGVIAWDSCGIDWPLDGAPIVSEKDSSAAMFSDFSSPFEPGLF